MSNAAQLQSCWIFICSYIHIFFLGSQRTDSGEGMSWQLANPKLRCKREDGIRKKRLIAKCALILLAIRRIHSIKFLTQSHQCSSLLICYKQFQKSQIYKPCLVTLQKTGKRDNGLHYSFAHMIQLSTKAYSESILSSLFLFREVKLFMYFGLLIKPKNLQHFILNLSIYMIRQSYSIQQVLQIASLYYK